MQLVTVKIDKPEASNFILVRRTSSSPSRTSTKRWWGALPGIKFGLPLRSLRQVPGAMVRHRPRGWSNLRKGTEEPCCRTLLIIFSRWLLSLNAAQYHQNGSGGVPHLLCDRQPDRSDPRRDGTGTRYFGRYGRLRPKGIEGDDDIAWREDLLRQIGYKLDGIGDKRFRRSRPARKELIAPRGERGAGSKAPGVGRILTRRNWPTCSYRLWRR